MNRDLQPRLDAFMAIEEHLHEVIGAKNALAILMDTLADSHVEHTQGGVKQLVILQDIDSAVQWNWTKLLVALNAATTAWYAAAQMPIKAGPIDDAAAVPRPAGGETATRQKGIDEPSF